MSTPLSRAEIKRLCAYLEKFPPLTPPPADLPYFDIGRIAATLVQLQAERDFYAENLERVQAHLQHMAIERSKCR